MVMPGQASTRQRVDKSALLLECYITVASQPTVTFELKLVAAGTALQLQI